MTGDRFSGAGGGFDGSLGAAGGSAGSLEGSLCFGGAIPIRGPEGIFGGMIRSAPPGAPV